MSIFLDKAITHFIYTNTHTQTTDLETGLTSVLVVMFSPEDSVQPETYDAECDGIGVESSILFMFKLLSVSHTLCAKK